MINCDMPDMLTGLPKSVTIDTPAFTFHSVSEMPQYDEIEEQSIHICDMSLYQYFFTVAKNVILNEHLMYRYLRSAGIIASRIDYREDITLIDKRTNSTSIKRVLKITLNAFIEPDELCNLLMQDPSKLIDKN